MNMVIEGHHVEKRNGNFLSIAFYLSFLINGFDADDYDDET